MNDLTFNATPITIEGPHPIIASTMAPEAYPIDALGPLKNAALGVRSLSQAPIEIAAQSAMGIASVATQSLANVHTLSGSPAPLSLFLLTVALSGERKSSCDKLLSKGLREFEQKAVGDFRNEIQRWEAEMAIWQARRDGAKALARKGDAESAEEAMSQAGDAPTRPGNPLRMVSEPTFEGLTKLYQESSHRALGLLSDEGGQFLGGHAMNSENKQKTLTALAKLWDGDPIQRTRAGDGTTLISGCRLATHLMVQPVIADELLADHLAVGQGFLARFLISHPTSTIGSRLINPHTSHDIRAENALFKFQRRLEDVLAEDAARINRGDLRRTLTLSDEARLCLIEYYNEVEKRSLPSGDLREFSAAASKSAEQACRIAGVLTVWADCNARMVEDSTMHNAIALARYYLSEASRLSGRAVIAKVDKEAEALRVWLVERWPHVALSNDREPETILPRDIQQFGPNALRSKDKSNRAINRLVTEGWLAALPAETVINGKNRKAAYRICKPTPP